jgi:hypothetical protein
VGIAVINWIRAFTPRRPINFAWTLILLLTLVALLLALI